MIFFFQAEDGIRDLVRSRGLGDVYKRQSYGFKPGDYPRSEAFYQREISIPMFPKMTDEEVDYVISTILEICL